MIGQPSAIEARRQRVRNSSRATRTALLAIGFGAVFQVGELVLGLTTSAEQDRTLRLALVLTMVFYGLIALWVLFRADAAVRPVWSTGNPLAGAAIGMGAGLAVAGIAIGLLAAVTGHLAGDPGLRLVVAEGTAGRVVAMAVIAVVCAPLVEEWLFRGLMAESLRTDGAWPAVLVSSALFALWHLRPAALRYYILVGVALGVLYLKRGLVASIAAHATFNGTLLVVAVVLVHGAPHGFRADGVRVRAPASWQERSDPPSGADLALDGPAGAQLVVSHIDTRGTLALGEVARRVQATGRLPFGRLELDPSTLRTGRVPAGAAVQVDGRSGHRRARVVLVPRPGRLWWFIAAPAGSRRASRDLPAILDSALLP